MARLANFEMKIINAHRKLYNFNKFRNSPEKEQYKNSFMDACQNNMCADAVDNLVSSLDGNFGMLGCDMISILYNGDTRGEYHQGWRDIVTTKATYLLTLVNSGLTSQSAYFSFKENKPTAWKVVQHEYQDRL